MAKMIFVTVGTTKFDDLIQELDSVELLSQCAAQGYTHMRLQIGNGQYIPSRVSKGASIEQITSSTFKYPAHRIQLADDSELFVDWYRKKPSVELFADLEHASLVISHAGAGSIMEALRRKLPLIVVVNESLMNNHQGELAEALAQDKHLVYCSTPRELQSKVVLPAISQLRSYDDPDLTVFPALLEEEMGMC